MNKQEKNIVDTLTFEEIEDIVNVFIHEIYNTDKTVAIITNKELIEYTMDELISDENISVQRIDLEMNDVEYMLSVNNDGYMVVQPVEYYEDKYFKEIEYAYVDMDGCVDQMTIDRLLDRDIPVVLFGLDDECDCDECECLSNKNNYELDEDTHGFSISNSNDNGTWSYSFYSTDRDLVNEMLKMFK